MRIFLNLVSLCLSFALTTPSIANEHQESDPVATSPKVKKLHFHGQASQDEFVHTLLYKVLGKQDKGFYLEVGAGYPIMCNNTYLFEKEFNWEGISLDITPDLPERWYASRENLLMIQDATTADYGSILSPFPSLIDYLSLDIDNYYDVVLNKLPNDTYAFKIITIEHDFYHLGDWFRKSEREILTRLGYYLLCPDVIHPAVGSFEDWWIHPSAFPADVLSTLSSLDLASKEHTEIIKIIKNAFQIEN